MGNEKKISRDQKTFYIINMCTQFEECIFMHEAMNAEQGHYYVPIFIKSSLATVVKWFRVTGDGYT